MDCLLLLGLLKNNKGLLFRSTQRLCCFSCTGSRNVAAAEPILNKKQGSEVAGDGSVSLLQPLQKEIRQTSFESLESFGEDIGTESIELRLFLALLGGFSRTLYVPYRKYLTGGQAISRCRALGSTRRAGTAIESCQHVSHIPAGHVRGNFP